MDQRERTISIDEKSVLFDRRGMVHKEFVSDFRQVRYFGLLVVQKAPPHIREVNLLEQQVTELLKNAIKHGNKLDMGKKIHVWHDFRASYARLIVEDEGDGFKDLEKWNEFNERRRECLKNEDFVQLMEYASYHTVSSDMQDGGNALFAAVEYWNGGVVFNKKRNAVAVLKKFPTGSLGKMG